MPPLANSLLARYTAAPLMSKLLCPVWPWVPMAPITHTHISMFFQNSLSSKSDFFYFLWHSATILIISKKKWQIITDNKYWIVLGGCGILNSVSVFSRAKTSVSARKYTKLGKVCPIRFLLPDPYLNPLILRHHDFLLPSWVAAFHLKRFFVLF